MRLINEVLEVVWVTLAGTCCKVAGHVVAKRSVVRVLLNRHELHTVVAALLDVRQQVIRELTVLGHSTVLGAHTHVGLIYLQVLRRFTYSRVLILVFRLKMHGIEETSLIILDDIACPSWIPVHLRFFTKRRDD